MKQLLTKFALAFFWVNSLAFASLISVLGVDTNRGATFWLNADGVDQQDYAGVIRVNINGGAAIDAYCIDLFVGVSVNDTYNVNLNAAQDANRRRIAWLVQTQAPIINALANGTEKQQRSAALQLTIWDIIHDSGDGFAAGRVRWDTTGSTNTPTNIRNYSESYRTLSIGQSVDNFGLIATHVQGTWVKQTMFLAYTQASLQAMGIIQDTPEPATLVLSASAFLLLGLFRRRRPMAR